ncbi:MAG: AtpZ/AtpI family protein [Chloroflexi bacterium]|nr:AtpZ/AtpI family protein [Chloroflexota bacterium]
MDRDRLGRLIGLATELGLTMGLTAAGMVVLGLLAGRWLDARWGSGPIATMVLVLAGAIAGQVAAYRLARRTALRLAQDADSFLYAQDVLAALALAFRALAMIAFPSVIGVAVGLYVDRRLGTGIIVTLILVLSGLAAGLLGALRLTQARREKFDEKGR